MPTYILMTKLSPDVSAKIHDRASIGQTWIDRVKKSCPGVKFLDHYGLLGPYDFISIYEAPDNETAAKVSMISLAQGALQAESWAAIPYHRVVELAEEI